VTFTEQKLRQSVSHQRLPNMFGVFGPVWHYLLIYYYYNSI
jgi:hypothetical protein